MRVQSSRRGIAGAIGIWALALLLTALPLAGSAQEEWRPIEDGEFFLVYPCTGEVIHPDDKTVKQNLPAGNPSAIITQSNLTFRIFYLDTNGQGFRAAGATGELRQTRLEEALAYVARVINLPNARTLDVLVEQSGNTNSGTLAVAGTLFSSTVGYQSGTAFSRLSTGNKPAANRPEIVMTVNFGNQFNVTSGAPAPGQIDLQSVLVHETLHALGFLSLATSNGASQAGAGVYTVYDSLLRRQAGNVQLFPLNDTTPIFAGVAADLNSSTVVFGGAEATAEFGSSPPMFSPNPFSQGSSLSHWRTGAIPGGAVMEHAFSAGEVIRQFPRFEAAALRDLGYGNVNINSLQVTPTADFMSALTSAAVNQSIQFTDLSRSGSQPVTVWNWNFGDGTSSSATNPTHAYATAGTFNVTLTVNTGAGSDSEVKNGLVTVTANVNANFTASILTGPAPLQVQFNDTSNTGGLNTTSRQWNFGDGNGSTEQNPVHTYQAAGSYTVSLAITAGGANDTETKAALINVTQAVVEEGCGCNGAKSGESPEGDAIVTALAMGLLVVAARRRTR